MDDPVSRRVRFGMLTPSSNTALEPITTAMIAGLPEASVHFARFGVTEISLGAAALAQFDMANILAAAELLAHAKVAAIGWSGTSASWLGFEADRKLCAAISERTGIAATTSILALNELLGRLGARRLALVTPYTDDVQARIVANYRRIGIEIAAERHLGIADNFSFAAVADATIAAMVREVAAERPDAIAVVCTNMRAGPLVEAMERALGIPILDSVATVVWDSLRKAGLDPSRVQGWGRAFSL